MPVVKENRIVFGLEDLQRVIIRCLHCRGEVSMRDRRIGPDLRSKAVSADSCPHCGSSWKPDHQDQREDHEAVGKLLDALDHFTSVRFKERLIKREVKRDFKLELSGDIH